MTRLLLLLAAVTLCCCISSMHAFASMSTCRCIRTTNTPVTIGVIQKIEMFPPSRHCPWTEIIITRKSGSKVCIKSKTVIHEPADKVTKRNGMSNTTTDSPTASTIY